MKKSAIVLLASSMAATAAVNAATISFSDSLGAPQLTNFTDSLTFSLFDPSLGTLTSVDFELTGFVSGDAAYESTDAAPTIISLDLAAELTLLRPDLSALVAAIPLFNNTEGASIADGIVDFGGTSGSSFTGLAANLTETSTTFSALDLALFTGLGTIDLGVLGEGKSGGSGSGNLITSFSTFASAGVQVTYNYNIAVAPVPVPAAVWLFGSGLIGLVGVARRKQS